MSRRPETAIARTVPRRMPRERSTSVDPAPHRRTLQVGRLAEHGRVTSLKEGIGVRARDFTGLAFFTLTLVACATGSKFNGSANEGGSSTGGAGGDTSSGASAGSGGMTTSSSTTTSSSSSTTTTTPSCAESPCKVVAPQCGCDGGDMCSIDLTGVRVCHAPGATANGEVCTGLYSCETGSLCVQTSSNKSLCAKYCDADNQCSGGLCLIQLTDPNNPNGVLPNITLCTDSCDPVSGSGCPVGQGVGCGLYQEQDGQMRVFTLCTGAGGGGQLAACTANEDCQAGFACFTVDMATQECLKYCKVNNPSCPAGAACQDIGISYNGVAYGACL